MARCSARPRTASTFSARTMRTAASTRSRTIASTSRPTYPTSVYLLASTLTNGARTRRASRRAISVFPTPVGPIMRMFFGMTSSLISSASCWRRTRLRSAMATDRLAAAWPTMYLSSSATIRRGVRWFSSYLVAALARMLMAARLYHKASVPRSSQASGV